jgi:hypothetical protein
MRTTAVVAKAMRGIVLVGLLAAGCSKKSSPDFTPDPSGWFIESYDNGSITVQHEGNTYKATCDTSRSFNNTASITDKNNVVEFSSCDMPIGLVGHNVQPFEAKQRDDDGRIVNMWNVGNTLALRSWLNEKTPWRQEDFRITSVSKTR